jgi:hypothetical protein
MSVWTLLSQVHEFESRDRDLMLNPILVPSKIHHKQFSDSASNYYLCSPHSEAGMQNPLCQSLKHKTEIIDDHEQSSDSRLASKVKSLKYEQCLTLSPLHPLLAKANHFENHGW